MVCLLGAYGRSERIHSPHFALTSGSVSFGVGSANCCKCPYSFVVPHHSSFDVGSLTGLALRIMTAYAVYTQILNNWHGDDVEQLVAIPWFV